MKKIVVAVAIIAISLNVSGCSQKSSKTSKDEDVSQEKVVDTVETTTKETQNTETQKSTEKKEEVRTFQLSKDGKFSTAKLYIQEEAITKEEVIVEGPFSTIGVSTKEEAEKAIAQLEGQMNQIEGMNTYYTVSEEQVTYVSETDYEKVDFDFLGITEDMILAEKKLPKASVRVQDYEGMGYTEVK